MGPIGEPGWDGPWWRHRRRTGVCHAGTGATAGGESSRRGSLASRGVHAPPSSHAYGNPFTHQGGASGMTRTASRVGGQGQVQRASSLASGAGSFRSSFNGVNSAARMTHTAARPAFSNNATGMGVRQGGVGGGQLGHVGAGQVGAQALGSGRGGFGGGEEPRACRPVVPWARLGGGMQGGAPVYRGAGSGMAGPATGRVGGAAPGGIARWAVRCAPAAPRWPAACLITAAPRWAAVSAAADYRGAAPMGGGFGGGGGFSGGGFRGAAPMGGGFSGGGGVPRGRIRRRWHGRRPHGRRRRPHGRRRRGRASLRCRSSFGPRPISGLLERFPTGRGGLILGTNLRRQA